MLNGLQTEKIFTVSEFISLLNRILLPQRAIVQGEVGKMSQRASYTFFPLRDKQKQETLNCFVWQDKLEYFGTTLKEGMEIKVEGFPAIFRRTGSLNFQVEQIALVGEGALKQAFEALKRKLKELGYFSLEHKKVIPRFSQKIGLITSRFAAAKTDFLEHLGKFSFEIYFYDVRVEGIRAVDDIIRAIRWFNENMSDIDVLVITRGGGSWESLQAFNSEMVARAIFASKIPIIAGVGHEVDETIAGFIADKRASTPTHAARILSDPWKLARELVAEAKENIFSALAKSRRNYQIRLNNIFAQNLSLFREALRRNNKELSQKTVQLFQNYSHWLGRLKNTLDQYQEKLILSSPQLKLKQGYSIVFNQKGEILKRADELKLGEEMTTIFYRGKAKSEVKKLIDK